MLILLHGKFEKLTREEMPPEDFTRLRSELLQGAGECENLILLIMGERSEKLAEIYCLYSFFEL
jgi:hypothetical protein